jgi:catechol 2,3-dioxygenase-like lactoylglutathione lyase family enzyme
MLGSAPVIAFAPSTDLARSRQFFGDLLGLRVLDESPFAVSFDAAGTLLRVTLVDNLQPAPFTILGWHVDNIATTARELGASGIAAERYPWLEQDAYGVWTAPSGDHVLWFKDPDGNVLSLTQFVAR